MQRAVNTIEKKVFSVWFAYIRFWATDVFSVDPPRDYKSSTEPNQIREGERESDNGGSPQQSRKKYSAKDLL
jgi:hypothetical protein